MPSFDEAGRGIYEQQYGDYDYYVLDFIRQYL